MSEAFHLYTLLIEVTQKCNMACDQCGSRCDIHSEELLKKEDILNALRDIKSNLGTDCMINITGGEPLMRQDIFELGEEITALGFDWGMVSNGSLITDEAVRKLKEAGMKTITISLDGLRETHDSLRHLKGSYDRIIGAVKRLKNADFLDHLQITFTVNRRNVNEFEQLYGILNTLGLDSIRVGLMDPIGRATENKGLLLTREEIIYFTRLVNSLNSVSGNTPIRWGCPHFLGDLLQKNRDFHCFAGIYTASILYNGDIFVCPNVPRRKELIQGNILRDSFSEVWQNSFGVFRERALPEKCRGCDHEKACKGDSFHTLDFDSNTPDFCFRDYIEAPSADSYKKQLKEDNPDVLFEVTEGSENSSHEIIIEPTASAFIRSYFSLGRKAPLSMYEQQMALIGFSVENTFVVRYVIPCDGRMRASDNAIFTNRILRTVENELAVINKNYFSSSDRALPGCELKSDAPMRFLGFIHSHPTQKELCYSIGDDAIHRRMTKKYGDYIGILVHPETDSMGAYYGEDIKQIRLIRPI